MNLLHNEWKPTNGRKAVFFDVDGTLINIHRQKTKISEPVKEAIRALRRAGHHTFIASGRPRAYLSDELSDPELFDGYVLMNGAVVLLDGKAIFRKNLPRETLKKIVALLEEYHVEYVLESEPYVYMKKEYKALENVYTSINISMEHFVREYDESLAGLQIAKIEIMADAPNANGLFHKLLAWPGLTGLIDPTLLKIMEVYSTDVSKATGIAEALKYLAIPAEQSYAFGDGLNDLEMMETVGTSLVMGNAGNELKTKADHVLPTVDEDGVAEGIYRYILKTIG